MNMKDDSNIYRRNKIYIRRKSMQNAKKKLHEHTEQKTQRKHEIAATSWGAWLNLTKHSANKCSNLSVREYNTPINNPTTVLET